MYPEKMPQKYVGADLTSRVHETFVKFKDEAWYAVISTPKTFTLYKPGDTDIKLSVPVDSPDLDISSIELGYFQDEDGAYYARRQTSKKYKQGVSPSNISVFSAGINKDPRRFDLVNHKGFARMLDDKYPEITNLNGTLSAMSEGAQVALSKDVAVEKDVFGIIKVFVRQVPAGYVTPGSSGIVYRKTRVNWVFEEMLDKVNLRFG